MHAQQIAKGEMALHNHVPAAAALSRGPLYSTFGRAGPGCASAPGPAGNAAAEASATDKAIGVGGGGASIAGKRAITEALGI